MENSSGEQHSSLCIFTVALFLPAMAPLLLPHTSSFTGQSLASQWLDQTPALCRALQIIPNFPKE